MAVRKQRRGDAMITNVLNQALLLLAEVGFERLTLPEVAVRAGVNKTSLYRRWPTKALLVRDALASAMAAPVGFVATGELRRDLVAWGSAAVAFSGSALGQAVFRALLVSDVPELQELSRELRAASAAPRRLLDAARKRGELAADVDSALVLSMIAGTLMHRQHIERRPIDQRVLATVIDIVLDGVRAAAAEARRRPARRVRST